MKYYKLITTLFVLMLLMASCQSKVELSDNAISVENYESMAELYSLGDGVIYDVKLSPSGTVIAVAGSLGVRFYDKETFALLQYWENPGTVISMAWSPDNNYVGAGYEDKIYIWDYKEQKEVVVLESAGKNTISWSPDGTKMASGVHKNIRVWNTGDWNNFSTLTTEEFYTFDLLSWSADSSMISSGNIDSSKIKIWEVSSGEEINEIDLGIGVAKYDLFSMSWTPSNTILTGINYGIAATWEWDTYLLPANAFPTENYESDKIRAIAWSPDAKLFAAGYLKGIVGVWDVEEGEEIVRFDQDTEDYESTLSIDWTPDGREIVSTRSDNVLRIWDIESETTLQQITIDHSSSMSTVAFSPDNTMIAYGGTGSIVYVYDIPKNQVIKELPYDSWISTISWSPDGKRLIVNNDNNDSGLDVWDTFTWEKIAFIDEIKSGATDLEWSPNGKLLAVRTFHSGLFVIDMKSMSIISSFEHDQKIYNFNWLMNNKDLLYVNSDGNMLVWNYKTNKISSEYSSEKNGIEITSTFRVSPNGEWFAVRTRSSTIDILTTSKYKGVVSIPYEPSVSSICWSPDEKFLVIGRNDGMIDLISVDSKEVISTFQAHVSSINAMDWSNNGEFVSSVSSDGITKIWGIAGN